GRYRHQHGRRRRQRRGLLLHRRRPSVGPPPGGRGPSGPRSPAPAAPASLTQTAAAAWVRALTPPCGVTDDNKNTTTFRPGETIAVEWSVSGARAGAGVDLVTRGGVGGQRSRRRQPAPW